jgi:hypothetical protein
MYRQLNIAVQNHCQALCTETTSMMVARLPRELRDIIYEYIFDTPCIHISNHNPPRWNIASRPGAAEGSWKIPSFLYSLAVHDATFATDLSEFLWTRSEVAITGMDNLLACLVKDVFQTSITPLDHTRRLEVRLYIHCHYQPRLPSWKPPRSVYRGPLWKADLLAYVYPLTKLLDSNVLQKLDIEIIPRRDSILSFSMES